MRLNTYQSAVDAGVFVTIPTAAARATLHLVDGLQDLQLHLVRRAYQFPDAVAQSPFVVSILTQVIDEGYAMHADEAEPGPYVR